MHDDLANVQPAIVGAGDGGERHRRHRASASKQLARQRRLDAEDGTGATPGTAPRPTRVRRDARVEAPRVGHPGPERGRGTQRAAPGTRNASNASRANAATSLRRRPVDRPTSDRETAQTALDLEVTRRREREARAAMEKMERAVETLKAERDDAVERAMRATVAADAARAARDSALERSRKVRRPRRFGCVRR